jgi:hypothetical protein
LQKYYSFFRKAIKIWHINKEGAKKALVQIVPVVVLAAHVAVKAAVVSVLITAVLAVVKAKAVDLTVMVAVICAVVITKNISTQVDLLTAQ